MSNDADNLQPKDFIFQPIHFLAYGLGSGLAPKAPGTWGTVAALLIYLVGLGQVSGWIFGLVILLSGIAGIYICDKAARDLGVHDHGSIVWDEFVGYWLTMLAIPFGVQWALLGFALFRLFDIWKPWPIGWVDKQLHGGLGIMADDILAGIYANLILHCFLFWL